ncbi:hypothetical protein KUV50_18855 [Membranicola marinus]|uniref:Uncharacterized protein n=1 Tax=Membranihabitans marinus TaxID=1227546 RepID=A0A953LD59_9BACT|nr:hypothetical protein [Membranihabitans marinus]MBY5960221.1 hypothetical protein [Membranihabitans marinus]
MMCILQELELLLPGQKKREGATRRSEQPPSLDGGGGGYRSRTDDL